MSLQQAGAYIRLMCRCWLKGSLPSDVAELGRLCGATPGQMRKFWPDITKCFQQREDGRWIHARLDKEREKQATYRDRASRGGSAKQVARKHSLSTQQAVLNECTPISYLLSSSSKEQKISAEPSNGSPPVLVFSTVGRTSTWDLTNSQLCDWKGLFPHLDVSAEMRKAAAWVQANPSNRKTAKGMPRFLVNWLNRAVDSGRNGASRPLERQGAAPMPSYEPWVCPHVESCLHRAMCDLKDAMPHKYPRRPEVQAS